MIDGKKNVNIDQVVSYLTHTFAKVAQKTFTSTKNSKGTKLYKHQVEFCYLIDNIQRGPVYTTPKLIAEANNLIADMESHKEEQLSSLSH